MTNQELLLLKLSEYELCMSSIRTATDIIAKSRRETTSGFQTLVLTGDLNELERRVNDSLRIKWPVLPEAQPDAQAELIAAYDDYLKLMDEELGEVVPIAYNHHWRSTRYDAGKIARARIAQAKEALYGSV